MGDEITFKVNKKLSKSSSLRLTKNGNCHGGNNSFFIQKYQHHLIKQKSNVDIKDVLSIEQSTSLSGAGLLGPFFSQQKSLPTKSFNVGGSCSFSDMQNNGNNTIINKKNDDQSFVFNSNLPTTSIVNKNDCLRLRVEHVASKQNKDKNKSFVGVVKTSENEFLEHVVWQPRLTSQSIDQTFKCENSLHGSPNEYENVHELVEDLKASHLQIDEDRDNQKIVSPKGWEARMDSYGRIFYINHEEKTTSWIDPALCAHCIKKYAINNNEEHKITSDQKIILNCEGNDNCCDELQSNLSNNVPDNEEDNIASSPAVLFLQMPNFFLLLNKNLEALKKFNENHVLKHLINKIRKNSDEFKRYQHNKDLVSLLNMFSDSTKRLPSGWEMRFDKSSKSFFIDHTTKNTTYIDPRLPHPPSNHCPHAVMTRSFIDRSSRSSRSLSSPRCAQQPQQHPDAYSNKVISFLRQPNIISLLSSRSRSLVSNIPLRNKILNISKEGSEALNRFSDDVHLNLLLSQFDDEIMTYQVCDTNDDYEESPSSFFHLPTPTSYKSKEDFQTNLEHFHRKLHYKGYACGPEKTRLEISRDKILSDAYTKVLSLSKKEMQKNKLLITFAGEEGLDYGGPSKEFFYLLSRELFNPYYGLFEYSSSSSYTLQISPLSVLLDDHLEWFHLAGRVIGLSVLHHHLLDVFFIRPLYKALLKQSFHLSDLEYLDYEYYKSLLWIRDGDDVNFKELNLNFCCDEEVAGKVITVELKTHGQRIPVTHKNRKEYVDRMVKRRLLRGVESQLEQLVKGFNEVLDCKIMSRFDAQELEFVISGTVEVDVDDWRRNTEYKNGYHADHVVIELFWMVVDVYSNEQRLRLLQFITGTSSIPLEGFAFLRGNNGLKKFSIEKWGDVSSLPRSHTCFNRLDLPPYTSYNMMYNKLTIAVEETCSYGIE